MAIEKIKCLRIIGLKDKLFDVAELLVNTQSFQPDDPLNFHSDIKMFIPVQSVNEYSDIIDKFNVINLTNICLGSRVKSLEQVSTM